MCFVCVISNQSTSKKPHVSDLSKLGALLHKIHEGTSGTKVTRLDMCRSILSFRKIAHEIRQTGQQKEQWE